MAQVVRFGPKSDDSTHGIIKSENGFGLWSSKNLAERNPYSSSTRYTKVRVRVRVAIDALDYEYNHDARTQSPRLTAARLQLAVGRRGLGPREKESSAPSASFVATYHTRVHTEQQLSCWAQMLFWKKYHVKRLGTSLRGQTRVLV